MKKYTVDKIDELFPKLFTDWGKDGKECYVALFDQEGKEITGKGYSRQTVFLKKDKKSLFFGNEASFPYALESWGFVDHWKLFTKEEDIDLLWGNIGLCIEPSENVFIPEGRGMEFYGE